MYDWNWQSLADLISLGGPIVVLLVLMSVYGLAVALLKLWQFRQARLGERDFIEPVMSAWGQGDAGQAQKLLEGRKSPIARGLSLAIRGLRQNVEERVVREEVARGALRDVAILRRHLRSLELIGNLAPLLGLLGTVIGMIDAFSQLEAAGSQADPGVLSGGIWEALLTTAVGLTVAIPALSLLNYLEGRVEHFHEDLQDALTRVFTARDLTDSPAEPRPAPQGGSGREEALEGA